MSTINDPRYIKLIEQLQQYRQKSRITQTELATSLNQPQSFVAKVEGFERRLDVIELYDWLTAINANHQEFFQAVGWFTKKDHSTNLPALPIPKEVDPHSNGVIMKLAWQGEVKTILLEGIGVDDYLDVESEICRIYSDLNNTRPKIKNREAICKALDYAVNKLLDLNPSDIYHHIVYRFYLREYSKTQADRSWVRAGGEAIELFVEQHYKGVLFASGIKIKALISGTEKSRAIVQMGLSGEVGSSKLDVTLYGIHNNHEYIFGGIHIKASLAERVSDDVPCSEAMMRRGFVSYLFTFDAKSFPPPAGDLVNRGELGTLTNPSDKRRYIEDHGSFDACFSYNLRSVPSGQRTKSGKKIYTSSFKKGEDPLPGIVISAWKEFKKSKGII